jgi:hypothetical protein
MQDKNELLNQAIDKKHEVCRPTILFKYRPFDELTFDMLGNGYIYLCPAEKLDDPSECVTTVDMENYYDILNNTLRRECVELILNMVKPYTSQDNYEMARNMVYRIMTPDFRMRNNFLLDYSSELQEMCPNIDTSPIMNWLVNIPSLLDDQKYKPQIETLLLKGLNAREEIGICSLAESCDIEDMWTKYANNDTGYCIEYDLSEYEFKHYLFPVVYEDNKETNLIIQTVATFIGQMIFHLSNKQANVDRSQFLRLFLTKDTKWAYQKEWRIIDKAGDKIKSPNIRKIILGKNIHPADKINIIKFCNEKDILYTER